MSFKTDFENKRKVVAQVEVWLAGYEMPVNIHSVISALVSLGYLSSQLTQRAADGLEHGAYPSLLSLEQCHESSPSSARC